MSKYKDAERLIDIFGENFELFGKAIKAEKRIDRILDAIQDTLTEGVAGDTLKSVAVWTAADAAITGATRGAAALIRSRRARKACAKYKGNPEQFKKCVASMKARSESQEVDYGKGTDWSGRPYDHPKKIRVTADVDECDMQHHTAPNDHDFHLRQDYPDGDMPEGPMDNDPMDTDYSMGDSFEGEFDSGPSEEETAQKHTNDINNVPNQNGRAQYKAIRKQMGENWMDKALDEGIKDRLQNRRCEKIKKDIASFRKGYANCRKKYIGQRLQDCLEPLRGGRMGLVQQAKKWGCIK